MTTSNDKGRSWLAGLVEIARDEFISIGTSYSTLLLFVGGVFIYGFLYNLMYMPNLVRNAPIAVITPAETEFGREYVSLINATHQLKVMYNALDINQAKELIQRRDVIGAVYLPSNFDRQLMNDESATALVFGNTATFQIGRAHV